MVFAVLLVNIELAPVLYTKADSSNRRLPYKTSTEVMDLLLDNWEKVEIAKA